MPIVSVSQKPIDFGDPSICVGQISQSAYNCYLQIFIGLQHVKTRYVACIEDDAIYSMEHFSHRPSDDRIVSYNANMWFLQPKSFWKKMSEHKRLSSGMFGCIASTHRLLEIMKARFDKYPFEPQPPADTPPDKWFHVKKRVQSNWQEPGRFDRNLGTPRVDFEYFETVQPIIILNRRGSLGGRRRYNMPDIVHVKEMEGIGNCDEVWTYYMGENSGQA
jgi:hypothetical protein